MTHPVERYAAAERLLPSQIKHLVQRARVRPAWDDGSSFHYGVRTDAGLAWFSVDCETGQKQAVGAEAPEVELHELLSPDRTRVAFVRGEDLWVRQLATGVEQQLTTDGTSDRPYARNPDANDYRRLLAKFGVQPPPAVIWSPDSTRLLTHQLDQTDLEQMHLVQSAAEPRPQLHSYRYALVGDDAVTTARLLVLDVIDGSGVEIGRELIVPYASPLLLGHAWWSGDGEAVWFVDSGRNGSRVELVRADAATGESTTVITETSPTHVQLAPVYTGCNIRTLASGETIWWSERTGWGHLYLYAPDGSCAQLTHGHWLVRDLVAVDERARRAWFTASGREPDLDPYLRQLYAIHLDTREVTRLTDDELDHELTTDPTDRFAVDVASAVDVPAISSLWDLGEGSTLELERADATALYEAGWTPPERFQVRAADGVTPLYGLLFRPHDFDAHGSYAVLDDIYPGPQVTAGTVRFPGSHSRIPAAAAASMAALGFAVVVIEGRGTPLRSKAFQDATRGNRDVVVDDHVAALQQLAADRPWLDLDRVGIYGSSGGGMLSTRALLLRPDIYKVAVSTAGDHDDASYHAAWGERFSGDLDTFDYAAASNAALADRLEGKLLLIHGDMDDNVTPHQTLRLVDAFMTADKDVDLLLVPNSDHTMLTHQPHWIRRRWDYFVTHLLQRTPATYRLTQPTTDLLTLEELFL